MNLLKVSGLYGLVLAGGQSLRMGKDKSMLDYHGMPQRDYVFQLLNNFCEKVYTSVGKNPNASSSTNTIEDAFEIKGPLNAMLSAFKQESNVAWLTVPVDMPYIDADTIQYLIEHRNINRVATCFYDADGQFPEPLLTIWEPKADGLLRDYYNQGKISPREFLMSTDIQLLNIPDKKALTNVNTPEDFGAFFPSGENY